MTETDAPSRQSQSDAPLDLAERGANDQRLDERLYMQLLVMSGCSDTTPLVTALRDAGVTGALYADMHDPYGVALLTISGDPEYFIGGLRRLLHEPPFAALKVKPRMTMLGRTYALGYEADLHETLFHRPMRTALNPDWPWAIWYPLRRNGAFEQLGPEQQREILMEHGRIGMGFGRADLAHDVRLACHGLDPNDNDFVVALVGKQLHPLSAIVQAMRRTTQTSQYLDRLGPFFVGRAIWQAPNSRG